MNGCSDAIFDGRGTASLIPESITITPSDSAQPGIPGIPARPGVDFPFCNMTPGAGFVGSLPRRAGCIRISEGGLSSASPKLEIVLPVFGTSGGVSPDRKTLKMPLLVLLLLLLLLLLMLLLLLVLLLL